MQLSEAEIANIIRFHTRPWWDAPREMLERHIDEAAHAIAEALKEGAVANIEGRWTIDDLGYYVLTIGQHNNWEGQKIRLATVMQGELSDYYGECVTITVSKKEE